MSKCSVAGCIKPTRTRKYYCEAHYYRIRRTGVTGQKKIKNYEKHGKHALVEYNIWSSMLGRCLNENNPRYSFYGGRGIKVCKRWQSFTNFLADIGERPTGMSLDRINNDKGYSPSNCRWATRVQQMNNRRSCHNLTFNGMTMTIAQWARHTGIKRATIKSRILYLKWDVQKALTTIDGRISSHES